MKGKITALTQKKIYQKPNLKSIGKLTKMTMKTGSKNDFGAGKYEL